MDEIRNSFIAVAFLLLVAEPSAALNISTTSDDGAREAWLCLNRHSLEFDREDWAMFMIESAIGELAFELSAEEVVDDDDGDLEISLTRVWERP